MMIERKIIFVEGDFKKLSAVCRLLGKTSPNQRKKEFGLSDDDVALCGEFYDEVVSVVSGDEW